jgi:hypothetical protein
VKIGFIVNYVRDTRGISPQEQPKDFDEDVERVFAEVDRELRFLFDEPPDAHDIPSVVKRIGLVKTYDQFVFWFSHVLNEIQNGTACDIYGTLLERLQPNDALLTFNWDTILDRALYETRRWFPDDGYGVGFDGLLDGSWRPPRATVSSHLLLKLHGSTNWFGPYVTRHLQTGKRTWAAVAETSERHWCLVNGTEWFSTYKDRWRPGYAPFSYFFAPNDPIADLCTDAFRRFTLAST